MDDIPWLRDVLRFALTATASTAIPWGRTEDDIWKTTGGGDLVDPDDPGKDPRFRKLVEAILFSRRFLKTYKLGLLGLLLVFTAWHWAEKLAIHRRKRRRGDAKRQAASIEDTDTWSSSSSTIEGNATPPYVAAQRKTNDADETSPLLAAQRTKRSSPGLWRPYYILRSILQYQPPRIPIIHKVLPTNAVSLLVVAWVTLNIFYNLYRMPLSFLYLFVFADRCGIIFISNLPLLYLLAAKNQPIKFLTGYSYESLNIFHRRVGEAMCLEAFLHFLGMIAVWYGMLRHLGFTLARFLFNRVVLLGLAAFIAYELIYFTSLGSFRQRWYEIFLALHIILQIAGLVFLWFHHYTSRPYVGVSLAIFLIDRLMYRLWLKSSTHPATLTLLEDNETILLSANWEISSKSSFFKPRNMINGWTPNDHVFISIPTLSRKYAVQSHPFTIFSAAPNRTTLHEHEPGNPHHAWFSLLIRAHSTTGFTHTLLTHARSHPTTPLRIRLDGPYGSPHALDLLSSSSTAIIVAGGSGIAVAYPLLYALLCPNTSSSSPSPSTSTTTSPSPSTTSTSPKDPEYQVQGNQTNNVNVKLLWITHSPTHTSWLPPAKLQELLHWGLELYMSPPTALAGRPDVSRILRGWVAAGDKGRGGGGGGGRTGIVVSGPEGLVRQVRNFGAGMVWEGGDVDVCVEKFGW